MPAKPLLVYDGRCSFCRRWIVRWKAVTGESVDYEPYQTAAARFPEAPPEAFERSVQLIEPSGRWTSAAHAVFRTFALAGRRKWLLWLYENVTPFAKASEASYEVVAGHRELFDVFDVRLFGRDPAPPTYAFSRWLFLRALAVVCLIAFASLWVQIDGLVGSRGVLPVKQFLDAVRRLPGGAPYHLVPTLCWFDSSDRFLHFLCGCGVVCSVLLLCNVFPALCLVLIYAAYLSLVHACQDFLGFQWDTLLLETAFLAVFLAPAHPWPRFSVSPRADAPRIPLFLIRWLLFRLMLLSGIVKLASGDPTWHGWTALTYHYLTQPLPPWTAWYMHHLPRWFQMLSCGVVFLVELPVPLMIFLPRQPRRAAFWLLVLFQVTLIATGNYGFFNLLAIVLCIPLTDDLFWPARLRALFGFAKSPTPTPRRSSILHSAFLILHWLLLLFLLPLTCAQLILSARAQPAPVVSIYHLYRPTQSFFLANTYGLFASMTTTRPEIIVEGSNDRVTWKAYAFKYKPGDLSRRPPLITGHMPRLDWMMWFAAIYGDYRSSPWAVQFFHRLLQGSPPVLDLLEHNPFPDRPPRYLRAMMYDYQFTTAAEKAGTGNWWKRTPMKAYFCPVITIESFGPDQDADASK